MALYPASLNSFTPTKKSIQPVINNNLEFPEYELIRKIPLNNSENSVKPLSKKTKVITNDENKENMHNFLKSPCKPQRMRPEKMQKIESPYKEVMRELRSGEFKIKDQLVNTKSFAAGSYVESFDVIGENFPKDKVLLKAFLEKHAVNGKKCEEHMETSVGNFLLAKELGLPCAEMYNVETAVLDKYYLVEKIPHKIDLTNKEQMDQVRKFFEVSKEKGYLCDLSYDNLRVREDGTVVLIDFVEKNFEMSNTSKYRIFAIQFLKSWVAKSKDRESATELLQKLTEGLGFDPDWLEGALSEYFLKTFA